MYVLYDRQFIRTPPCRGEELRLHLATHGIKAKVSRLDDSRFDRVDLAGEPDPSPSRRSSTG